MKKLFLLFVISIAVVSCEKQEKVDTIVMNSNTYTVNSNFDKAESFAIKDGKFIAVGTNKEIQDKYMSSKIIDAKYKAVYPGFIDGHCHFYGLGLQQQKVNLVGTKSYNEVLQKLVIFQKEKIRPWFIYGDSCNKNIKDSN